MQKYNVEDIEKFINLIIEDTIKIKNILDLEISIKEIKDIDDIYKSRKKKLDKLQEFAGSRIGVKFISANEHYWNSKINELRSLDQINLKIIETNTKIAGEKVKNVYKQKSLLVYAK